MPARQFNPGDLVLWNRNSSDPDDLSIVGMVIGFAGEGRIVGTQYRVKWADGIDETYPADTLRLFNPCAAAAA